jgi:hypothetical protein
LRRLSGVLIGVAILVAGCGGSGSATGTTSASQAPPTPWWLNAPRVEFGLMRSLTPLGQGYKLRLDLHLLFGPDKTGLAACIDNHDCTPGTTSFPDDTYDHDLEFVVTYYVPPNLPVQLVSLSGGIAATVTARYLYGLSLGHNPRHLKVATIGPEVLKEFGYYLRVRPRPVSTSGYQTVTRLSQVFHP